MDTQPKIAIIIPTFLKDDILMETINSILDNYQDNWIILIGEQNEIDKYSLEKNIFYHTACAREHDTLHEDRIKVHKLPYDCGLSYARNSLVKKAKELNIDYCLISADSIKFTESMKHINLLINYLNYYDVIGLELDGRISWEAELDLKDHFELNFIHRYPINALFDRYCENPITIWNCDIVRNFFLAKTKTLLDVPWDNKGKMAEHTPWFWDMKQAGYKVGFTDYVKGKYIPNNNKEYKTIRAKNMTQGKKYYKDKYNLKQWTKYINFQNIRRPK